VVVALLLNHIRLEPGQALFLPAGNLHAYLRGVGVEVMANSDNVLRGGLTAKHIDVEELMTVVDRRSGPIEVQRPAAAVHTYDSPIPEFAVTRIDTGVGPVGELVLTPSGPEIVLVTDGSVELTGATAPLRLGRGRAAFVAPSDGPYRLAPTSGDRATLAWRVTVGDGQPVG
jgi:mannose-6-phosphate isomerase